MIRDIKQIGDPVLDQLSKDVTLPISAEVKALAADLVATCISKEDITAGLSAPQIGVNLNVIVCRRMDLEEASTLPIAQNKLWEVMLNPVIKKSSKKESAYWEGCLSVGTGQEGLWAPVFRPDIIDIEYLDLEGNKKALKCKNFFAHIVQHEIDHLKGCLFLKYVDDPTMIWKTKDLDAYYEAHGEYPPVE